MANMATSALRSLRKNHPKSDISLGYKQLSRPGGVAQGRSSCLESSSKVLEVWSPGEELLAWLKTLSNPFYI